MSEATIRCQWCNLEQYAHNSDFTCGVNTKGWGHKWWPGPYSIDYKARLSEAEALLDSCEKALNGAKRHIDFHSVRTKEWSDNTNWNLKVIGEVFAQIKEYRRKS